MENIKQYKKEIHFLLIGISWLMIENRNIGPIICIDNNKVLKGKL